MAAVSPEHLCLALLRFFSSPHPTAWDPMSALQGVSPCPSDAAGPVSNFPWSCPDPGEPMMFLVARLLSSQYDHALAPAGRALGC